MYIRLSFSVRSLHFAPDTTLHTLANCAKKVIVWHVGGLFSVEPSNL